MEYALESRVKDDTRTSARKNMKRTAVRAERRRLSLFCLISWGFAALAFRPAKAIDEIQVYNARRRYWFRQIRPSRFCARCTACSKLDRDLFVGLEYYADFGEIGRFGKLSDQQHTLFAVTDFKLGVFDCNLGVGYGLTPIFGPPRREDHHRICVPSARRKS
jgi:hypothetical protein